MFYLDYSIYPMDWIDFVIQDDFPTITTTKKIQYLNVASCFDIETTSFYTDKKTRTKNVLEPPNEKDWEKRSLMYGFVFGINGKVILARTWEDFFDIIERIKNRYNLSTDRRMIVYVHNLSFEFQYLKDRLHWGERFFALEERKPLQILAEDYGIEFRDSYILTGYSLAKVGDHLHKYKVSKLVGDIDYSLFRHNKTPLTYLEQSYMRNDSLVVMAHIQEEIERLGNITKIPLTKTGYVRNAIKKATLYGDETNHKTKKALDSYYKYNKMMKSLEITSVNEYLQLKRAFTGGFTHCNALYNDEILKNVTSKDFTSSYPYTMLSEKFPCQTGKLIDIKSKEEFRKYLSCYCCIFDATFERIEDIFTFDHYISVSKCFNIENPLTDNGRLVKAKRISITLTEVDFDIIEKTYKWKSLKIKNFRAYMKNYLPTPFVSKILDFYNDKTKLKDVEGFEIEYIIGKENLNSCYGMSVTDICRPDCVYNEEMGEWEKNPKELEDQIKKYNTSRQRFLCYQWGIWVTAYARRNLWSGILELGIDHGYSDTDSLKYLNYEKHSKYFEEYNRNVEFKLREAMNYHNIPFERCGPKTIKGKTKLIGVWDDDGFYKRFKTLGAKRYIIEKEDGKHSITISGVNKLYGIPFLENKSKREKKDIMDLFTMNLFFPKEATGKKLHTYIDKPVEGYLTDYKGDEIHYNELSGIHLEGTSYDMSLASSYIEFLKYIKGEIKDL